MGASFTEIAEELGYASRGAAYDAFKKGYAVLTDEIRGEAAEAIKHQLARNIAYRKKVLIQANASGDQIAGAMAALAIDKFDSALRGRGRVQQQTSMRFLLSPVPMAPAASVRSAIHPSPL